jgi:cobyrinic acid a,c-diamide synthase
LLRCLGAEVVFFSPLAGDALPACDALWLPGGYPELHAARLAARTDLRAALADHVAAGRPLWAECGGMMVLFERLVTAEGRIHAMWDLLPGVVTMGRGVAALGPQQLILGGLALRGHTFHWSRCETPLEPHAWCTPARGGVTAEGEPFYQRGVVRASYLHAWFASSAALTARLFLPQELPTS